MISQIPVASWYDMFLEHTYAEACLARLLSEAYRLEMNGRNMRNIEPINRQPYTADANLLHRYREKGVPFKRI